MESGTRKSKLKIIIPIIIAIVIVAVVIVIMGRTSNKDCIGTWIIDEQSTSYYISMTLYQGGTGKGTSKSGDTTPLTWEIKDNILNISSFNSSTSGYKVKGNEMTSVDGERKYIKY